MIALLRMMRALFLRGWYTMLSYRFALYLRYVGVAFQLVLFYFTYQIFRDLQGGQMVHIADAVNSNNYLDYAVTGGLAISLLGAATGSMMSDIRSGQVMGTLETILASPMSVALLLAANWTYTFTRAFVGLGVALFVFVGLMDFKWENMKHSVDRLHPRLQARRSGGAGVGRAFRDVRRGGVSAHGVADLDAGRRRLRAAVLRDHAHPRIDAESRDAG